jgi:hypothetical protein
MKVYGTHKGADRPGFTFTVLTTYIVLCSKVESPKHPLPTTAYCIPTNIYNSHHLGGSPLLSNYLKKKGTLSLLPSPKKTYITSVQTQYTIGNGPLLLLSLQWSWGWLEGNECGQSRSRRLELGLGESHLWLFQSCPLSPLTFSPLSNPTLFPLQGNCGGNFTPISCSSPTYIMYFCLVGN